MKRWLTIFAIAFVNNLHAQYQRVEIPGSEIRKITSEIVKGQEYELQVLLPGGYTTSQKKYPVVYLMDSQWDFPLVKSIYGQQYYDGFIPELIVVGVTWGGVKPNPDSLRARDYTPTKEARIPQSGGADQFLSFMKNELFPFIEKNYRADYNNRTLMGCSLGGLITLYALFTQPDLFTGYAAASPAIGWDREVLYKYEKEFQEKKLSKPVRLYMTLGDVERSRPRFEKFADLLTGRKYSNVSLVSKILENTGHSGTKSETYSRGLQFVFEKPRIQYTRDEIGILEGIYQTEMGLTARVSYEENALWITIGGTNKFKLYASSKADFYSVSEFMNIHFELKNDSVVGLRLDRYGNTSYLKKQKG